MIKKYFLLLYSAFLGLNSVLVATAQQHSGGSLGNVTSNSAGISPLTWGIFVVILLIVIYGFYWLFSKNKKSF